MNYNRMINRMSTDYAKNLAKARKEAQRRQAESGTSSQRKVTRKSRR